MSDKKYFTLIFEGDLSKLRGNPFHMETTFGKVVAAGFGHAFDLLDDARARLNEAELILGYSVPFPASPTTERAE